MLIFRRKMKWKVLKNQKNHDFELFIAVSTRHDLSQKIYIFWSVHLIAEFYVTTRLYSRLDTLIWSKEKFKNKIFTRFLSESTYILLNKSQSSFAKVYFWCDHFYIHFEHSSFFLSFTGVHHTKCLKKKQNFYVRYFCFQKTNESVTFFFVVFSFAFV